MAGRKSKYESNIKPYLDVIQQKVREGVTEAQIAKSLGVSVATLNTYKTKHEELKKALSTDKGADVLEKLVNAGIEASIGYYKENETTTITIGDDGKQKKSKVISKTWYPPNPVLNKFYVLNFGKDKGFVQDPLDYELKKAKQELDEKILKDKNWMTDFDDN